MYLRHFSQTLILVFVTFAALPKPSFAQIKILRPAGLEETEGNRGLDSILGPVRVQGLGLASDFEELPEGGAWLVALAERADKNQRRSVDVSYDTLTITASTTDAENLSFTFADNVGADAVEVIDSPRTVTYEVSDEGSNPFSAVWEFDKPFFYDPAKGNLLLEFASTTGGSSRYWVDMHGVSHRSEVAGGPGDTTAHISSRMSVVTQHIFVPEELLCVPLVGTTLATQGDLDRDGQVSFTDFLMLSSNFGNEGGYDDGDVDCSGTVDFADFLLLSSNFGHSEGAAAVPEPSGGCLAAFVGVSMLIRRRRTRVSQR